jgi:hypothetical protein
MAPGGAEPPCPVCPLQLMSTHVEHAATELSELPVTQIDNSSATDVPRRAFLDQPVGR